MNEQQLFYGQSRLHDWRRGAATHHHILAGRVIRINPALITLIDGQVGKESAGKLQQQVLKAAVKLLDAGIHTFHVDVNFPDYGGFGANAPQINTQIFTPAWLWWLYNAISMRNVFINLHLLTDDPCGQLAAYAHPNIGAICFQLDAVRNDAILHDLLKTIHCMGAVASPVIETQGTIARPPDSPEAAYARLKPHLSQIHMLTIQAANTAARSDDPHTAFDADAVRAYLRPFQADPNFTGTIQVQGGITTATVANAVECGAEFLVAGTQIFHNQAGLSPAQVVNKMLQAATVGVKAKT